MRRKGDSGSQAYCPLVIFCLPRVHEKTPYNDLVMRTYSHELGEGHKLTSPFRILSFDPAFTSVFPPSLTLNDTVCIRPPYLLNQVTLNFYGNLSKATDHCNSVIVSMQANLSPPWGKPKNTYQTFHCLGTTIAVISTLAAKRIENAALALTAPRFLVWLRIIPDYQTQRLLVHPSVPALPPSISS